MLLDVSDEFLKALLEFFESVLGSVNVSFDDLVNRDVNLDTKAYKLPKEILKGGLGAYQGGSNLFFGEQQCLCFRWHMCVWWAACFATSKCF